MAIKTTELIRTSQSWDGAQLPDFPQGKPELRVVRLDFPVGAKTGWHHHPVINYGIVQQGDLTIVCQDGTEKTFHEGEALVEVIGTIHRGENRGSKPVILNMFYFSSPGAEITIQHPEIENRKTIEVVAAVIFDEQGRIFATQRGYGEWKDWWEFPGGKIEAGETPQQALKREIREELDAEIEVGPRLRTIDYDYPAFHLTMHCFKCHLKVQSNQRPGTKQQSFTLLEHEAAKWLIPKDLNSVNWLPADEEIINELAHIK